MKERRYYMDRGRQQHRVTVRSGLGDIIGANDASGATRSILNNEVLTHRLGQLLRNDARDTID